MTPVTSQQRRCISCARSLDKRSRGVPDTRSDLFGRGRRRRRRGVRRRNLYCRGCERTAYPLLLLCVFQARPCLRGSLLRCPVLFSFASIDPGAIGNKGPKLGRKLLYSPLSFSFGLCGVRRFALRLNNAGVGYSLFPFGHCFLPFIHCFLSLNQCFLAYIQLCFPFGKLCFSGRILLLAGANHRK